MNNLLDKIIKQQVKKIDQHIMDAVVYGMGIINTSYSNSDGLTVTSLTMDDIIKAKRLIEQAHIPPVPEIITNIYMTERVLTKHPRKKKNRRWDKKYWKKYSVVRPMRSFVLDNVNKKIYCHPSMVSTLRNLYYTHRNGV